MDPFDTIGGFTPPMTGSRTDNQQASPTPPQGLYTIPHDLLLQAQTEAQFRRGALRRQQGYQHLHDELTHDRAADQTPHAEEASRQLPRPSFPVVLNSQAWRPAKVECTICLDSYLPSSIKRLTCGHSHCDDCIKLNARVALESSPFSPAKCCHVIPRELLTRANAFTGDEAKRYSHRMEELTNPHYKLYCSAADCGAFIPVANQRTRVGECPECGKKTCKACRQKSHWGPCDQEKLQEQKNSEDLVYKLAAHKGWKRCPNCLNIVQKHGGCNHMSCNCGQSFCYACGHAFSGGTDAHLCSKDPMPGA
ncbi:hypothetical protein F5X96DRAFT_673061 [Biscogniauxia mediterranea]|nr:hypothetical protein F5X96DRAFT_673061 [Biscogniauxia mediterranea]